MYLPQNTTIVALLSTIFVLSAFGVVTTQAQTGPTDSGTVTITINPGVLSVSIEDCDMGSLDIGGNDQETSCTTLVQFEDLRGTEAGWNATATMTNFAGDTSSEILSLCREVSGSSTNPCNDNADFSLTPGAMSSQTGQPDSVNLDNVLDNATQQPVGEITGQTGADTNSTPFALGGFSAGGGAGAFEKNVELRQVIPAYTQAQVYSATLTVSVS